MKLAPIAPLVGCCVVILSLASALRAADPRQVPLWPADKTVDIGKPEQITDITKGATLDRKISDVSVPTLYVCLPPHSDQPTPAVVICPGGGYGILAVDREGFDEARFLNARGVAAFVLKYRLPRPALAQQHGDKLPWPMLDALRAMRLVRSKASEWNLDPKKIGLMGFSAGGHLAAWVGTHADTGDASASDPIDRQSARPDFLVLGYALISMRDGYTLAGCRTALLGKNADPATFDSYSSETCVTAQTPPTMLVHAKDDNVVKLANSEMFYEACKKNGVPAELKVYKQGGHGFGAGHPPQDSAVWLEDLATWMRSIGMMPPAK